MIEVVGRTGVNVTRDGSDPLDLVLEARFEGIRIPVTILDQGPPYTKYDLRPYLQTAKDRGLKVILVLDRDAFYWPDWRQDTARYVKHWVTYYQGLFDALEVGNEWDHVSQYSWDIPPQDFSDLLKAVREAAGQDVYLISGGMAEGQPDIARQVDFSPVNAWAFHPYAKDAPNEVDVEDVPDVDGLYGGYKAVIPDRQGLITEWGWPGEWGEDRQAEETVEMILWCARQNLPLYLYNLRDGGESFGLVRQDGEKKVVFSRVQYAIDNRQPIITPVTPPAPPVSTVDPWQYWNAAQMAAILDVPQQNAEFLWPKLVEQMVHGKIVDRLSWIAMACTVRIETGGPTRALRFTPVREAYWMTEEWREANFTRYYPWYGRGPIQCTWKTNYDVYSRYIDDLWQAGGAIVSLVASDLDAMLDPDIGCAFAATYFMHHGGENQYKIVKAAQAKNWTEVRRLVQGGSAGLPDLIKYATAFLDLEYEFPIDPRIDYSLYTFPVEGYTGPINLHHAQASGIGGSDIFAPRGTPVRAIADGTVVYRAVWNKYGGNAVQLEHDHDRMESYYAHGEQEPLVQLGQHVTKGTLLFSVGDTGNATAAGPHLHFGMGFGINDGDGVQGGLGINFDAVTFLRALLLFQDPEEPALPCANLISALGYLSGDVARRLDKELSDMTIPPVEPKSSKRTKAYYQTRAEHLEKMIHEMYADGQKIKDELIRVGVESLS